MMDEVKFFYNKYDLRELKLQTPNVDFHFAINPNGEWCELIGSGRARPSV